MTLVLPRRQLLKSLVGLIAAPAIVRSTSLMPIKVWNDVRVIKYTTYLGTITVMPSAWDAYALKALHDNIMDDVYRNGGYNLYAE